jgi:hypothetical protein
MTYLGLCKLFETKNFPETELRTGGKKRGSEGVDRLPR